jgi:hypothetical protein
MRDAHGEAANRSQEYETLRGPSDIKLSKPFLTPGGDEIRVVRATGTLVMLTAVGKTDPRVESITLQFPPGTPPGSIALSLPDFGGLWDKLKEYGKMGLDLITGGGGGGSQGCGNVSVTVGDVGGQGYGGGPINVNITVNCSPQ